MSITWFGSSRRIHKDTPMKITFVEKPHGIRLNAGLTRKIGLLQIEYVKLGVDSERNIFMMIESSESDGLKITKHRSGNSGQISASLAYVWALKNGLIKQSVNGVYNEETKMFEFDLSEVPPKGEGEGV